MTRKNLKNGKQLRVFRLDTDEQGKYWAHWFDGEYLSDKNAENGAMIRIKHDQTGEQINIKPEADNLKVVAKP